MSQWSKLPNVCPMSAQCLHKEVKDQDHTLTMITQLAVFLPNITNEHVTIAGDGAYREVYDEDGMCKRVDMYWNYILDMKTAAAILKCPEESCHIIPVPFS